MSRLLSFRVSGGAGCSGSKSVSERSELCGPDTSPREVRNTPLMRRDAVPRASNPNCNLTLLRLLFPSSPSVSPSLPYAADGKADSRNRITSPVSAGIYKAAIAEQIVILVVACSCPVADFDPAHGEITGSPVTISGYRIPRRGRNRDFDRPITSHVGIHSSPSTVVYREF